jgi:hypothetical protein
MFTSTSAAFANGYTVLADVDAVHAQRQLDPRAAAVGGELGHVHLAGVEVLVARGEAAVGIGRIQLAVETYL